MTKTEIASQALSLPERDRFELAQTLWASLDDPDGCRATAPPLPDWQKRLLDERLAASADDPGKPWEAIRGELWPEHR